MYWFNIQWINQFFVLKKENPMHIKIWTSSHAYQKLENGVVFLDKWLESREGFDMRNFCK